MFGKWPQTVRSIQLVGGSASDELLEAAKSAARLRTHMLLHESHADQVQRLLIGLQRGTYVQPHRHPEQWELIVPLEGTLAVFLFSETGVVLERFEIAAGHTRVMEIPAGLWHTLVPVSERALMFEIKPGPFRPAEFALWSPAEGTSTATRAAAWLQNAEQSHRFCASSGGDG
ncbi:WbuC family cupin fold metalloprotein [Bradyrhizobium tropiciagri]|uniref:WbuC family cupin fold metalloprotein n=1 Tax=Bradyrhizobium tropiciagri TaxID=312253 RepID=UPI00067E4EC1|nr:WbuC family cupin fold metalloprotein [Bradyrhizobium tropiciagri]